MKRMLKIFYILCLLNDTICKTSIKLQYVSWRIDVEKKIIVVVDDHLKSSELYSSSLEVYLNVSVVLFNSIDQTKSFLENNIVDGIITRPKIGNLSSDKIIYERIKNVNKPIFLYVLGKSKLNIHEAKIFKYDFEISNLIRCIAVDLGVTPQSMASLEFDEYYPFNIKNIIKNLYLACDTFIKKEDVFIKLLSKNSSFSSEVFDILKNQGSDQVYVKAKDRLKFINSQLIHFQELLAEDKLSIEDEFILTNSAYKLIKRNVHEMNISTEVIITTEKCINIVQSIVKKIPSLEALYGTLRDSEDIDFNQMVTLCFICNHLIDNIEWGTSEQKVKLTFVSFFHNITLSSEHVLINDNESLNKMSKNKEEQIRVLSHALDAAKIVSRFKKIIPLGVDTIIKQHHGSVSGKGFNSFPQSISPLAIIFLVADEWVSNILRAQQNNHEITKNELMNNVKHKYKTLSFEKVINAFEKMVI